MLVHIVGSRYQIVTNVDHLRQIAKCVQQDGHKVVRDWIEPAYENAKAGNRVADWVFVYKESLEAINKADLIIADSTIPSFSVGYQVAMAMQMKKPILVLNKEGVTDSPFASGIEAGITYKGYNDTNLKSIIGEFLKENDIQTKDMRFNFFIDRPIYNYLRWTSHKTGKTKAEILRDLVIREIDRDTPKT